MQEKTNSKRNLIISFVIIAAIGVAGYMYSARDRSADILLVSTPASTDGGLDGDLLSALRELKRLRLDDSIFSNSVWLSLYDFGQILTQQPANRLNPFAPLESSYNFGTTTPR